MCVRFEEISTAEINKSQLNVCCTIVLVQDNFGSIAGAWGTETYIPQRVMLSSWHFNAIWQPRCFYRSETHAVRDRHF